MVVAVEPQLLERERDLDGFGALLAGARGGRGALAMVEAPAGQGKTALLRALRARANEADMHVLAATGAELERSFAFGVVRQLFEAVVTDELLAGAAARAAPIFSLGEESDPGTDVSHARLHGLFWLCANLAERRPLVLVVDDAHWADAPSLRFLDVLARRVEDLPALVAIGTRPAEPGAEQDVLDGLLAVPAARVFRPAPLSAAAIGRLAEDVLGRPPDAAFAAAAAESTGGNALFARELLRAAADDGLSGGANEVEAVRRAAPATVTRMVVARLRRLSTQAGLVARAVAVLGERSALARVAQLAEVSPADAMAAAEALVRAGLMEPERLVFAHPIVREAVLAGFAGAELRGWHRRAARLLADAGAREEEVAAQLVASEPAGDPWAAEVLARVGGRALVEGAPDVARRLLAHALDEPPADDRRAAALLALGTAEVRTGNRAALEHLEAAVASDDGAVAARAARLYTYVLRGQAEGRRVGDLLRGVLRRDDLPAELRAELDDDLMQHLSYTELDAAGSTALAEAGAAKGRPAALAQLAWLRAVSGATRAEIVELVRRATADGRLLRSSAEESMNPFGAIEALLVVEAADEADAALREVDAALRRSGSPFGRATLSFSRPHWDRLFGDLRRAELELRDAAALFEGAGAVLAAQTTVAGLAFTLLDRGATEEAEALAAGLPATEDVFLASGVHGLRARLHAEQGRWAEALDALERHFAPRRLRGEVLWLRSFLEVVHVRALLGLDRDEEALALADAEVALHERRGALGHEAMARLSRALVVGGDEAVAELRTAGERASRSPVRLAEAHVLAELGATLRRDGRRVAARDPLRRARELARRVGATGLEARIHDELLVAGARPQRIALAGIDALTPSERRVADLAADGLSNRAIAEALFVTVKTVEVHLGRAYGKLDIKGRPQLAAALGGD